MQINTQIIPLLAEIHSIATSIQWKSSAESIIHVQASEIRTRVSQVIGMIQEAKRQSEAK